MLKKQLIHIGTFGQPFGLKGEVMVIMHMSDFNLFKSLDIYFAEDGSTLWDFYYLNMRKGKLLAQLNNCNNRNCAEKLKGKKIFTYHNNLPRVEKNQFYTFDLINCEVKTSQNKLLGKIINIDNFGAGDLMNIEKSNGKSFYIPFNKENLIKIDIKKKIIIVNPIKGILD